MTELEDVCSLSSGAPSLDKSNSESSDSSGEDRVAPLSSVGVTRPRFLRQRNSGLNSSEPAQYSSATATDGQAATPPKDASSGAAGLSSDFIPQFLLPQNLNVPIPKGPIRVRKDSDFDRVAYTGVESDCGSNTASFGGETPSEPDPTPAQMSIGRFRTREEIVLHFMVELNMLWRDSAVIVFGILFQWFHSILTNLAYYTHTQLTAAQRVPLKDVAYDNLPILTGGWWMISEYLVFTMVAIIVVSIASILVIRWNAPHGRPLYCIPILRRMLMTLTVCQALRCISFLVTTLPGASRQCLYDPPRDMTPEELLEGPAHDRGNPDGWAPPVTINDIIWRVDVSNGCGDLMFSSHTIFTMVFVCLVWRYFNWGILKWSMLTMQIIIVPFILAAHKHYTVDVFTALYVTPLVFEVLRIKFRDLDVLSTDMASHYGIRFTRSYLNVKQQGVAAVVMSLRGGEFYVELPDIPVDLQKAYSDVPYSKVGLDSEVYYEDDEDYPTEFDPFDV